MLQRTEQSTGLRVAPANSYTERTDARTRASSVPARSSGKRTGRSTAHVGLLVAVAGLSWTATPSAMGVDVTIVPAVEHQTILGWGASTASVDIPQPLRDQILDEAVFDLGLTRLRLGPPSGNRSTERRWEWLNDNGDPDDINQAAFGTTWLDKDVTAWYAPFKQRVEAHGDPFCLYVSPSFFDGGSSGAVPIWLLQSPGEYAEFAISLITHLRDTHGITPDFYCILNEPGNSNPFTENIVGKMIKTLGPKLQALGLSTQIEFPECVSPNRSWDYIQALQDDPEIWPHVGLLSYHLYGSRGSRPNIRDFGIARGIPTAQTEFIGTTVQHLYEDLTLGGVSYWEHYVLAYYGGNPDGSYFGIHNNLTSFVRYREYWNFRQVMHYVRPGAVRVEATSSDAALRPLAFIRNARTTLVLLNNTEPLASRTVDVSGLPAGTYGVCHTVSGESYHELGLQTVGTDETLHIDVAADSVLTIYPYSGANQPPTLTDWRATPNYLALPGDTVALSASATDPELDAMTFAWSVVSQPADASAALTNPNAPSTTAGNLDVAGEYVFGVAVSDAANTTRRQVHLNVYANNQAPVIDELHNRNPVLITLPQDSTELRVDARDLENDPLSFQWHIVSQPPGANAHLSSPTSSQCPVSNMTIPGDYVFRVDASDGAHTVSDALTVPVYPVNTAPVIANVAATPSELVLPTSGIAELSADTSDPDGDTISHWWSIKSRPTGAAPVIAQPGAATTEVTGLTTLGTYVFTLTVVDRTKSVTAQVTVVVREYGPLIELVPTALTPNTRQLRNPADDTFTVRNAGDDTLVYQIADDVGWLSVDPPNGSSTGEEHTIAVQYATESLPPGQYDAVITVEDPNALNSPQTIDVTLVIDPAPGDFNADGHVDLNDYAVFVFCFRGPNQPPASPESCALPDFDSDSDVDLTDYSSFLDCYNGPGNPPSC
jgi:hypothetical protein